MYSNYNLKVVCVRFHPNKQISSIDWISRVKLKRQSKGDREKNVKEGIKSVWNCGYLISKHNYSLHLKDIRRNIVNLRIWGELFLLGRTLSLVDPLLLNYSIDSYFHWFCIGYIPSRSRSRVILLKKQGLKLFMRK